jgi:hypothetical protein
MGLVRLIFVDQQQVNTDDGLDAGSESLCVKLDQTKQIALIRQCDGRHLPFHASGHQCRNTHRAVDNRVLGVRMQMDKLRRHVTCLEIDNEASCSNRVYWRPGSRPE